MRNTSSIMCDEDDNECVTWTVDGNTHRGCLSEKDLDITEFSSCKSGDLCNNDIYPKDRLRCIVCSANSTDCIAPSADLLYPCRNYIQNDKCYSYIISMPKPYDSSAQLFSFITNVSTTSR
jgi:hypothetical protein